MLNLANKRREKNALCFSKKLARDKKREKRARENVGKLTL